MIHRVVLSLYDVSFAAMVRRHVSTFSINRKNFPLSIKFSGGA
ncbi:hypothetical protein WKV44_07270 [Spirochaetia bacterium 38H-sp]|uniref:Uncharacterized protein n=1 Tax=Rarispira pelagica TaxID=3141764 RepID=A0ABU9UCE9_9SPIR